MPNIHRIIIEGPYTTTERDALVTAGLPVYYMIFNSTTGQFEFWTGAAWQTVPSESPTFANLNITSNLVVTGDIATTGALQTMNGGDLASANDLTLLQANFFNITGTTQINRIASATATDVILHFASSLTVKHNQASGGGFFPVRLAGAVDFVTATDDMLLITWDVGGWREVGRSRAAAYSGTYTPTLTNVANLGASTAYQCQWIRVGNIVNVSGKVDVDPTLTATATQLGISLPVASNIGAAEDCAGTAFASGIAGQGAAIIGDAANNRAEMNWIATDITNQPMYFTFQYEVI